VLVLAVVVGACGKTNRQVIEERRPAFREMRSKLRDIAAALPPPGYVTEVRYWFGVNRTGLVESYAV